MSFFSRLFRKKETAAYGNIDVVKPTEYINALHKETESSEKPAVTKKINEPDLVAAGPCDNRARVRFSPQTLVK
ncbi:MAG: hypothetical protein IJM14_07310 [Lachnospiraceae bacterium]|nr:hypothetical protein [Lachnospiraceae bacterium]